MKRRQAITAILDKVPTLVVAAAAWLQADAAKRSEAQTYQQAGESFGQLAERVAALEAKCGGGR